MSSFSSLARRTVWLLRSHPAVARKAKRLGALTALGLTLFVASATGFRWYRANYAPLPFQPVRLPDPVVVGGPDAAMERTKTVIALLKAADWDPFAVPNWLEEFRLPDAHLSGTPAFRNKYTASYTFPNGFNKENANDPAYRDMACYTSIYARSNPTYYPGDKVRFKPSGFYIVGWKDGRVTKVALQDVRWNRGEKEKVVLSFPGMPNYDPKGFGLASVQFPNGFPDIKTEKAYLTAVSGPCAGCKD